MKLIEKIFRNLQKQNAGDSSTNYQGRNITVNNYGIARAEVEQIALQIYELNILKFYPEAALIAQERAAEITKKPSLN